MDYHTIIYLAHILFGLAWVYLGYYGLRKKISPAVYNALIPISIAIIGYHAYKLAIAKYHKWVYLFHIFVIIIDFILPSIPTTILYATNLLHSTSCVNFINPSYIHLFILSF